MESQDPHKTTELRMNLAAVKRADPYAKEIVETSAHVAFYTFNYEGEEWEKTDVEGAFFVYKRTAEPFHSIFINNRLNTNSLVEPITADLELQSQPPFLLYRNERSRIRGFWFYNKDELERVAGLVNGLIKECQARPSTTTTAAGQPAAEPLTSLMANVNFNKGNQAPPAQPPSTATNGAPEGHQNGGGGGGPSSVAPPKNPINIFSMLSKAQEDFHNSMNAPKPPLIMPGPPPMVLHHPHHGYLPPPGAHPMPPMPQMQQMDGGVLAALLPNMNQQQSGHPHHPHHHNMNPSHHHHHHHNGGGGGPPPVHIGPPPQMIMGNGGKEGVTSQSVMNFFASAAKPTSIPSGVPQPTAIVAVPQPPPPHHSNGGGGGGGANGGGLKVGSPAPPPLLQRLMSNPVHTVEQIEMQHRAATPQDARPATSDVQGGHMSAENGFNWNAARQQQGGGGGGGPAANPPQSAPNGDTWASLFNAKGGGGAEGKEAAGDKAAASGLFKMLKDAEKSGGVVFNNNSKGPAGAAPPEKGSSTSGGGAVRAASKPALMPPTMFKKSSEPLSADPPTNPSLIPTGQAAAGKREPAAAAAAAKKEGGEAGMKPEPLNQSQMLQAMTYLMKNDPQFMRKLHEAYLKSFAEMVAP